MERIQIVRSLPCRIRTAQRQQLCGSLLLLWNCSAPNSSYLSSNMLYSTSTNIHFDPTSNDDNKKKTKNDPYTVVEIQKYLQRRWKKISIKYKKDPFPLPFERRKQRNIELEDGPVMPPMESSLTQSLRNAIDQAIYAALSFLPLLTGTENDHQYTQQQKQQPQDENEDNDDDDEEDVLDRIPPFRFVQILDKEMIGKIGEIVEYYMVHRYKGGDAIYDDEAYRRKIYRVRQRWMVKPAFIVVVQSTREIMKQRRQRFKNVPSQWTDNDIFQNHIRQHFPNGIREIEKYFTNDEFEELPNVIDEDDELNDSDQTSSSELEDEEDEELFQFSKDRYIPEEFRPYLITDHRTPSNDYIDEELWCYCLTQAAIQILLLSLRNQKMVVDEQRTGPSFIHTRAFRDLIAAEPSERLLSLIAVGQSNRQLSHRFIDPNTPPDHDKKYQWYRNVDLEELVVDVT